VRERERAFLAQCVALPREGEEALGRIDLEASITSEELRRAASHLRGRLARPLADLPGGDDALARTVAALVERAGGDAVSADRLEHDRILLELERVKRAIKRARVQRGSGNVLDLAAEREALHAALHEVGSRLQH
jgi:DNA primase